MLARRSPSRTPHCTKSLRNFPALLVSGVVYLLLPLASGMLSGTSTGASAGASEIVTFQKRSAQPGERSRQQLTCDLNLTMSIRQSGQIVQSQDQVVKRQQQRELTILRASAALPQQAEVKYLRSAISLQAAGQEVQESEQPVTGKAYHIHRQDGELVITYPDGTTPPAEELAIVQDNLATFGLPNPITEFFDGKRVQIGQTLDLPAPLARELLGFADTGNSVSLFRMKLQEVLPAQSSRGRAARFAIEMEAEDPEQSGVMMKLRGQLTMEIDTCRSLEVQLTGPVSASETHGPEANTYEIHTEGAIQVAVQADYQRR